MLSNGVCARARVCVCACVRVCVGAWVRGWQQLCICCRVIICFLGASARLLAWQHGQPTLTRYSSSSSSSSFISYNYVLRRLLFSPFYCVSNAGTALYRASRKQAACYSSLRTYRTKASVSTPTHDCLLDLQHAQHTNRCNRLLPSAAVCCLSLYRFMLTSDRARTCVFTDPWFVCRIACESRHQVHDANRGHVCTSGLRESQRLLISES